MDIEATPSIGNVLEAVLQQQAKYEIVDDGHRLGGMAGT
jgi:hypothetical protein